MTVSELRTLVDNLDEYIHIGGGIDRLKKMVLHLAVSGQLVPQDPSEGTGEELYRQIQVEKSELVNRGKLKKQKDLTEISNDEIPFVIPESWKWVRLGDLYFTSTGLTYKKDQLDDVGESMVRVMRGGNIFEMEYRYKNDDVFISADYVKDSLLLKRNQLITPAVTSIEHIGKIARIENDLTDVVVGGFVLMLSPWHYDDNISKYALLFFNTSSHREACRKITNKSGQAFYNLSREKLLQLPVSLPPLAEQKRIVAKVDSIFVLIDQLAETYKSEQVERSKLVASSLAQLAKGDVSAQDSLALTHLSEIIHTKADAKILRQTILHLAVSGQLVPQDPSEGTGEDLYRQIQAEKAKTVTKRQKPLPEINTDDVPFKIPPSWKWVHIGDVFQIRGGKRLPAGQKLSRTVSDHVYIRVTDMSNGTVDTSNLHYVDNKSAEEIGRYIITSDDLYLSIAGSIGKVGKIPQELSGSNLTENASRLTPYSNDADLDFYLTVIASGFVQDQFQDKKVQMAQPKLALFRVENSLIPLPPLAEQKRIVAKTTRLLDLVSELEKHLEK